MNIGDFVRALTRQSITGPKSQVAAAIRDECIAATQFVTQESGNFKLMTVVAFMALSSLLSVIGISTLAIDMSGLKV